MHIAIIISVTLFMATSYSLIYRRWRATLSYGACLIIGISTIAYIHMTGVFDVVTVTIGQVPASGTLGNRTIGIDDMDNPISMDSVKESTVCFVRTTTIYWLNGVADTTSVMVLCSDKH